MVKISYIILNIFFLPGARAPPKLNVASPLTMEPSFDVRRIPVIQVPGSQNRNLSMTAEAPVLS